MDSSRSYIHQIARINDDGTEDPMPLADLKGLYLYDVVGHDDWASGERYLVDQFEAGQWEPGRYRLQVSRKVPGFVTPVVTVERVLPLHPDYAKLPYSRDRHTDAPPRAYLHHLVAVYSGSTLEQIAEHFDTFDAHYRATVSTPELAERTGYQLAEGHRPLSPYADYQNLDEVPADKR